MAEEPSTTERLMNALISKMENMDNDVRMLKAENEALRRAIDNPTSLLRKAGFVASMTPMSEDVSVDAFRANDDAIIKGQASFTNEEIHLMSWEEIHEMAEQARGVEVE